MNSKTAWLCLISAELVLSVIVGAAVINCWYGLPDPPARSPDIFACSNAYSPRPTPRIGAPSCTAPHSTRRGKRMNLDKYTDVEIVAATICAEAGGEPWAGQIMCGEVIANRAKKTGLTPKQICLQPRQFSCWNNKGQMELRMQTMRRHPAWEDCRTIAESICRPGYKTVSPVTHYANLALCSPAWAVSMEKIAVVGRHTFFKEV